MIMHRRHSFPSSSLDSSTSSELTLYTSKPYRALMPSVQYEESDESIWPVIPPHFKHQHPLQLIRELHDINCSACHTSKLSPIYGCLRCEYFLHQSCLELPIHIELPLHDSHVLTIQPLWDNCCQICGKRYIGFSFGCILCLFFVGIECFFELVPTVSVRYKHHLHRLALTEKSYSGGCKADNPFCHLSQESSEFKLTKSYSLRCLKCDYNLHFLCGPLPCTIKHKSHLHALKLVDSIVEDDLDEYYCDICEEIRNPRLCVYYCEDCEFIAHVHCVISEIINVFKNNPEKAEMNIVGDLRFENIIDPLHNNSAEERLAHLLKSLDENDMRVLRPFFININLFPDRLDMLEQKSSSEDDSRDIIEELSFYNDDILLKIEKRLKLFKPCTTYHIQLDECNLRVVEVEGYKVTSNFANLFGALLKNYGDFGCRSKFSKNVTSVLLYFLCRIVRDMRITYVEDINEKQLFTWLYYMRAVSFAGFDLEFVNPLLDKITKACFGCKAMKFEDEAIGKLDDEIAKIEKKIFELTNTKEKLERHREQHRPGKMLKDSKVMEELCTEAKQLKYKTAGKSIV